MPYSLETTSLEKTSKSVNPSDTNVISARPTFGRESFHQTFPQTGSIHSLGAAQLARSIKRRVFSAAEVVEAHIRQIEEVNPRLNALVVDCFDRARLEARLADDALRRGVPTGPLHGVPITIKENFHVSGTPTTLGMDSAAHCRSGQDGLLVDCLRRAGAIVLGKTNLSQLMIWHESDNPLYGRTNNPWDTSRTSGGSTGGEAALIAAGGSPLGLGTDIGGSIRTPAHFCGVTGLKPTGRRLSLAGVEHAFSAADTIPLSPGPLARRVEDLDLVMKTLHNDPYHRLAGDIKKRPLGQSSRLRVDQMRIAFTLDDGYFSPSPGVCRAVEQSAEQLRSMGATVRFFPAPDMRKVIELYMALMGADGGAIWREALGDNALDWRVLRILRLASLSPLPRRVLGRLLQAIGQQRFGTMLPLTGRLNATRREALRKEQAALADQFHHEFVERGQFDAWILPPFATPAFHHGAGVDMLPAAGYAYLANLLNLPAGVVPTTYVQRDEEGNRPSSWDRPDHLARQTEKNSAGLPIGVQVIGQPWREDKVLAVMQAIEDCWTV